jgi:hypothetical protein
MSVRGRPPIEARHCQLGRALTRAHVASLRANLDCCEAFAKSGRFTIFRYLSNPDSTIRAVRSSDPTDRPRQQLLDVIPTPARTSRSDLKGISGQRRYLTPDASRVGPPACA